MHGSPTKKKEKKKKVLDTQFGTSNLTGRPQIATKKTCGAISGPAITGNVPKAYEGAEGQFEIAHKPDPAAGDPAKDGFVMLAVSSGDYWPSDIELWRPLADVAGMTYEDICGLLDDIDDEESCTFQSGFGPVELNVALFVFQPGGAGEKLVRCAEEHPGALPFRIARAFREH